MALRNRNGGSQTPDCWLKSARNTQIWVETFEDGSYAKFELDEKGVPVQIDYSKL